MVRIAAALAVLATVSSACAQSSPPSCSVSQKCPTDTPCCSQYGECGVGAYCLGGCDPRASFSLDSCEPEPVCQNLNYDFSSLNGITENTKYLGDSSKTDWVMSGEAVPYQDSVLLTMAPSTAGTVLASSTYMWYGNAKAILKTSRGRGVVTAFILLSDVKDEIDFEFIGVDLETAQTNYYFQGNPNYNNAGNISLSDTFNNFHTYEIDWTPDQIQWIIDGQVGRTTKRIDTWNATTNQWDYPQTPARVQLSIWPGGLATNAKGTIDWAGGEIDFTKNDPDIANQGYYYATLQSVSINCFNSPTAPGTNTGNSYTYSSYAGTNDTVVDGTKGTLLASFLADGTDPNKQDPSTVISPSATGTRTATKSTKTEDKGSASTPATVPGLTNGGSGTDSHSGSSSSSSASSSQSTDTSSSSGSSTSSSSSDNSSDGGGDDSGDSSSAAAAGGDSGSCNGGFCQGSSSTDTTKSEGILFRPAQDRMSLLAVLIALGAMLVL